MNCPYFQPDYDDIEEENRLKPFPSSRGRDKAKDSKKYGEYQILQRSYYKVNYTSFNRCNIHRSRLSIVDNIANFKMPLIDGAETVLNN
jgi:hypothetical protein